MKDRIRQIRKQAGLSQSEFAEKLGKTRIVITNIETGRYDADDTLIKLICDRFKVDEHWLRTGDGSPEIALTEYEEIEKFVSEALADKSDALRKRFLLAFSRLDADGWKAVATLVDQLTKNL